MNKIVCLSAISMALLSFTGCEKEKIEEDSGFENGYQYVDLGLSVKWATFNVGATKPEEYGDYYAWGETETKNDYSWSTYKWSDETGNILIKYNTSIYFGTVDNKHVLDAEDDVAHVKWGGKWRMPTQSEQEELYYWCTWTCTEQNGVNGYLVTSKKKGYTDRSIFLPANGYLDGTEAKQQGEEGYFLSSTLEMTHYIHFLNFDSFNPHFGIRTRDYGVGVRPVCP
jgi:hypothetical protein